MPENDPLPTDLANESPSDRKKDADERVEDRAIEELLDGGQEAVRDRGEPAIAGEASDRQIDRLRAELEEARDRALRTQAELENYRKRAARQIDEERRYANLPLIRDLLPVWDNVGRAIEAAEKTHQTASLLEGFKMVAGQLEDVLERHDCTKIDALGEPFDPNFHEAISQQPCDKNPGNTVLQVIQTGFRLHDRVVRPSQVIVSVASAENEDSAEGPEEEKKVETEEPAGDE